MRDVLLTDTAFSELPLHESLLSGLARCGFERCTAIQSIALPMALQGHDVAGQAQTGTGKTVAFLLATMQRLLTEQRPGKPRALILAPTRELAVQIHQDAIALIADTGLSLGIAFGGADYQTQRETIAKGVDILIGTPGRLIDYYKQKVFNLDNIQVAVMDEADRMFDLGFIKDVRYLLRRMPPPTERLNLLFSATLSWRVSELAYEHMNDPEMVRVDPDKVTADAVTQSLYHVSSEDKIPLLLGLLDELQPTRALIFVNTKRAADQVYRYLRGNGWEAGVLSGDVPQPKRFAMITRIAKGEMRLLVATDVAARGLHIPSVSHVFNFDLPQNAEDYVHRIGRTARAGEAGSAISLACEAYVYSLTEIESYIGHKIPVVQARPEQFKEPQPPSARAKTRSHSKTRPAGGRSSARPRRHSSRRH